MSKRMDLQGGLERQRFGAWHGWAGVLLIAVAWPLNWALPGMRTHILFFPLWLGYILVVDWLTLRRTGSSLLSRSPRDFGLLFLYSAPAWWLFEVINWRTANWQYLGREEFSNLEYFLYATLSFSTVMPAVFGTAELVGSFGWVQRFARGPRVAENRTMRLRFFLLGLIMLAALLIWPTYCYVFVWTSLFFLMEPLAGWLGRPTILRRVQHGDWRTVAALWAGSLICGFFWEMWNFYAFPKWIYHVPFVGFWHVFEMPLLGYLGYLPFALELYELLHLFQPRPPAIRV
jgi:hypothetical protein